MTQFRPISLCNVVYKLISKVLANCIKPFLNSLISPSQSAFILGRLITTTMLVAYGIYHFLSHKRQGQKGYASLKLDISKAYDRVEWTFLESVLRMIEAMGQLVRHAEAQGIIEGVPVSRSKRDVFEGIRDQFWQKINDWATKKLSQSPQGTRRNWLRWQGGGNTKTHWVAWYKIYRRKKKGGLESYRSLSFTWRSILRSRDLLVAGLRWQIGNRESVSIVGVPWIPRPYIFQVISYPKSLSATSKVGEMIDESGWKESLVREEFHPGDADCILSIPLPSVHRQDEIIYYNGKQGKFSVKSAYSLACEIASTASVDIYLSAGLEAGLGPTFGTKIQLFIWKSANLVQFERQRN
ncbi:UNVERIFIED_CONTAM: hypothetical protein Sradi_3628100 [Sesamum radiatum]|uniref:Reverse transcriptase domain-containing protein n=1 Tax=Sesamum radiatum TaxID=300843 RepID=A0AAW2QI02_SESRA